VISAKDRIAMSAEATRHRFDAFASPGPKRRALLSERYRRERNGRWLRSIPRKYSSTKRLRYSGSSLGYQLAPVIAGGTEPLITTALFATFHSGYAISWYIAACAVVSLVSAASMPDYAGRDISMEYDD
jgi:hypothetical protein